MVWSDNFENGLGVRSWHSDNNVVADLTDSPVNGDGHGKVLRFTDKASTGEWGSELRAMGYSSGTILISTFGTTPGLDTFTFTFDYFVPSNTASVGGDEIGALIRFTSGLANTGSSLTLQKYVNVTNAAKGQWLKFELTGTIPAIDPISSSPVLYMTPIILWNDKGTVNAANMLGYIDNVSLTVTPEPGRALLLVLGMAGVVMSRKRR